MSFLENVFNLATFNFITYEGQTSMEGKTPSPDSVAHYLHQWDLAINAPPMNMTSPPVNYQPMCPQTTMTRPSSAGSSESGYLSPGSYGETLFYGQQQYYGQFMDQQCYQPNQYMPPFYPPVAPQLNNNVPMMPYQPPLPSPSQPTFTAPVNFSSPPSTVSPTPSSESNNFIEVSNNQKMNGNKRFKTRLCRYFSRNGRCVHKNSCKYAHGEAELNARSSRIH